MTIAQHIYLLTGSNEGDRIQYLEAAKNGLAQKGYTLLRSSQIFETAAWGKADQQPFLNQCLEIKYCNEEPKRMLKDLLAIEHTQQRIRDQRWHPRTLDIDILLWGNKIIKEEGLTIPHPYLPMRRFALTPLAQLIPDTFHPMLQKSISDLLNTCNDNLAVKPLS